MNLSIIGSESSFLNYSDNAMAGTANAVDKAKVSSLESENERLQEEVKKLSSENQSLYTQIAQFKSAVKLDISSEAQGRTESNRELSDTTKEVLAKNHVNIANDSANFSKQSIQSQAGSMVVAQSKIGTNATNLISK